MKKILAILCGVTMMFAACTPSEESVIPVFPEAQTAEVKAGDSYSLTFDANTAWTVSIENDLYAQLAYNDGSGFTFDTSVSGKSGEGIVVKVNVKEDLKNYDADIVIPVSITMGNETNTLATLTVKKIERPASIVLNETFESVTFEQNGHPSWGGEFSNAAEKYHLNYSSEYDLEGVSMSCNLENDYTIKVYAYNSGQSICENSFITEPWVSVTTFGTNGFKVLMDLSKESAEWSWWDTQYESYVNFEDAEGNVLVSIFCTSTYKPGNTGGGAGEAKVSFVNPDMAAQVGMSLTGSDNAYTLTLNDYNALIPQYYSMCGINLADVYQFNYTNELEGILTVAPCEGGYYHVQFTQAAMDAFSAGTLTPMSIPRTYQFDVITPNWEIYTVHVVLNWIQDSTGDEGTEIVLNEMASQVGVTLEKIAETDADYDADYAMGGVKAQYRLTYTSLAAFSMPQYASLTVPNFGMGSPMGKFGDDQAYNVFNVFKDSESGKVLIAPNMDGGYSSENIPNGDCNICLYDTQYNMTFRIHLVVNVAQ